jgi:hypothetical protein
VVLSLITLASCFPANYFDPYDRRRQPDQEERTELNKSIFEYNNK